ncbi:hypothetical protein JCGZ_06965 [Jatropha curcas]|uniref:MADS-box domain-containing protein n=1 Tax=Jatropha curcas TaxID=180498 RepID=A0A067KN98_JATCU|nr:agamous-like MADS-box protein AGL61 [Jatropha curcas]KDP37622.1 hypothetical protein JCGZ_06965 [Jatropha curcas]
MVKRPSLGRQKIAIEKISKKNHLQVTFSKRRAGLFKKASELCTLCGVEIAIIVFSPANKAFSFGHPEVESILQKFLTRNPPPNSISHHLIEAHRNANVRELNSQLTGIINQLEKEKNKGEALNQIRKSSQNQCWWESPIDELGLQELQYLRNALEELKKNVSKQVNKILLNSANSLPFLESNGIGCVKDFDTKPSVELNSVSSIGYVNNFGYEHRIF